MEREKGAWDTDRMKLMTNRLKSRRKTRSTRAGSENEHTKDTTLF